MLLKFRCVTICLLVLREVGIFINALPTQEENFECTQPSEEIYKNCHPLLLSPGHMSCQCKGCDLNLTLTCHYGLWRPIDGIDLCEPKNPWYGCDRCQSPYKLHDISYCTSNLTYPGYLGEMRKCRCKNTCLDVMVKCHMDDLWHYDCAVPVLQFIPSKHMTLYFDVKTSVYTLNCSPGFTIQGENKLTCQNGKFSGAIPECVRALKSTDDEISSRQGYIISNIALLRRKLWKRRSQNINV